MVGNFPVIADIQPTKVAKTSTVSMVNGYPEALDVGGIAKLKVNVFRS